MQDLKKVTLAQYANSPTQVALTLATNDALDPAADLATFLSYVLDVRTATGFGLDILGKLVGVDRLLELPLSGDFFGFDTSSVPPDWQPLSQGTLFREGFNSGGSFKLPDDAFRVLVLTKALANIAASDAPSINLLLRNLFPASRGRAYALDLGNMQMQYTFEFDLEPWEVAMLTVALPHPTGVGISVVVVPTDEFFGFSETPDDEGQPFDQGVFFDGVF